MVSAQHRLLSRVELHRSDQGSGFTSKHGAAMLIEQSNPHWVDLYPGLDVRNDFGDGAS